MQTPMLDALVVGAGPSGLSLASELLAQGLTVRIIDKAATPPADASRALAIQVRTLEVFQQFGIVDEVLKRSRAVDAVNVIGKGGTRARATLGTLEQFNTPYPQMRMLPQHETEALLEARLVRLGGQVERGVAFLGYTAASDHVVAALPQGELRVRWLFGCDGSKSAVRHAANIAFEGNTYDDLCMVGDVDLDWQLADGELYICPSPRGLAVAFPQPGNKRFRVVCVLPKGGVAEGRELPTQEFIRAFTSLSPVPVTVSAARFTSRYRLHHRVAARFRQERVFLVGDAAHVHSPVGGQGMNTGIQDAVNLAWKVAMVTQQRAPAWILDTYESERRHVALRLVRETDRAFGLAAGHGLVGGIMRRVAPLAASRLLTWKPAQARAFGFFSQLKVRYRSSALTDAATGAPGPQPGERAPDARVDGSERLFSQFDGKRYLLLAFHAAFTKVAHDVSATYAASLKPVLVADGSEAHAVYGVSVPTAFLVRPDGYIAARWTDADPAALARTLATRLRAPMN